MQSRVSSSIEPWPAVYRSKTNGEVVFFDGEFSGTCIGNASLRRSLGKHYDCWLSCRRADKWKRLDLGQAEPIRVPEKEPTFPALYRAVRTGTVVMFTGRCCGTCVYASSGDDILGDHSKTWVNCTDTNWWQPLGPEDSVTITGG